MSTRPRSDAQPLESNGVVPAVMRAATRSRYGMDALAVTDVAVRAPAAGEVLVATETAAVNPLDWHMLTGTPWLVRSSVGLRRPTSALFGVDMAGTVVATGDGVDDLVVGDCVVGAVDAAFAEYVTAPERCFVRRPENIDAAASSGMGVGALTALQGLRDKAQLRPGERVLINGASGGVGVAAVQLAKWMGAEVTGVCSTRNVELVRSLGADRVVDYTHTDVTASRHVFDVVFDNHANHSLGSIRRMMTAKGRYVLVGGPKDNRAFGPMGRMLATVVRFRFASQSAHPFIAQSRRSDQQQLADLMASGDLVPVVERSFELDDIGAAMAHLATERTVGKLVLRIGG